MDSTLYDLKDFLKVKETVRRIKWDDVPSSSELYTDSILHDLKDFLAVKETVNALFSLSI